LGVEQTYIQNIFSSLPGSIYWKDKDGVYLGANDEAARMAGFKDAKELIGKTDYDLFTKEQADQFRKNDIEVMENRESYKVEEFTLLPDGGKIFQLSTKKPLLNASGQVIGILCNTVDITAQKELEKMTTRAETLRLIAASMAHELRTPLRAIDAGVSGLNKYIPGLLEAYQIAKKAGLEVPEVSARGPDALEKLCQSVDAETKAAFNVIDMLLVKTDPSRLKTTDFNTYLINECLNKVIDRYHFDMGQRKLVKIDDSYNFEFYGNELLVSHVFFNLIKNALYFIKAAGRGEINVRTEPADKSNKLYFRDTGTGISPEILPYIFDRFYSQTKHGTGVGLAFCKMVMEGMGGGIECHSKEW
jgi:PAS domain S-box-containing protein